MKPFAVTAKIVKDVDFKVFDELKRRFVGERIVRVGFPQGPNHVEKEGETYAPGSTPVAMIAAVHEFGSPEQGIPERPFMRSSMRANAQKYVRLNKINLVRILRGQLTTEQALGQLGEMAKGDVQDTLRNGDFAPLKQSTIDRKGSSKPLIDTGQLRQSVTYELGEGE